MDNFNINNFELTVSDGIFTLKNANTTVGFVRFNKIGEVEYIFVNQFLEKSYCKKIIKISR